MQYPETRKVDRVDDYHGTSVADPYRWLEDLDSEETQRWIDAQNQLTFAFLEEVPRRQAIRKRLTELWDYEKFGLPFRRNGRYFLLRNDGLQDHFVLYTMDSLDGEPRMLLDPNTWSEDGTMSLSGMGVAEDGGKLAYGVSASGSDWQEWKVLDVASGEDEPDQLRWVKFSGAAWTRDGKGFFYSRYPEPKGEFRLEDPNYFQSLHFHELGCDQSEDVLVCARPDRKELGFSGHVTEDGDYLVIHVSQGTDPRNGIFYKSLGDPASEVVELFNQFDASYWFVGNEGPLFWFRTDLDAPRGRLVAVDLGEPDRARWTEVIPEAEDKLEQVTLVGDRFIAQYLTDARSKVRVFRLDGAFERGVELPGIGTALGFGGRRDEKETFYLFTSFTEPGTIYRYDVETGESTVFRRPGAGFDPADYETRQVFYESKDGTRVPMFVTHRNGIPLDGGNPTILTGYGGFNISMTPAFAISNVAWMEIGGVLAVACLRGGGEYGEEWHQAGCKLAKQNVFDDFVAAAEWLIAQRYTSPAKLAISGGSNGGLLVAACTTQRPDLFGAALVSRGVLDMLRYHKFTIGWAWTSDYGSADDPEEFKALHAYSPLHNLRSGTHYPPALVTTADYDDRVVPPHSYKFISALQAAQGGPAPVLIRVERKAGHGMGTPTSKLIEEISDRFAFLTIALAI